jgi:hypothetical protein
LPWVYSCRGKSLKCYFMINYFYKKRKCLQNLGLKLWKQAASRKWQLFGNFRQSPLTLIEGSDTPGFGNSKVKGNWFSSKFATDIRWEEEKTVFKSEAFILINYYLERYSKIVNSMSSTFKNVLTQININWLFINFTLISNTTRSSHKGWMMKSSYASGSYNELKTIF